MEITIPKRIRDLYPQQSPFRPRQVHRTRSSANRSVLNGTSEPEEKPVATTFSPEELDLEMVVVCAGEFVKEVQMATC